MHLHGGAATALVHNAHRRRAIHRCVLRHFEVDLTILHIQQPRRPFAEHYLNAAKLRRIDQRLYECLVGPQRTWRFPLFCVRLANTARSGAEIRTIDRDQHSGYELHWTITARREHAVRPKRRNAGLGLGDSC